jgi:hypothetical protein
VYRNDFVLRVNVYAYAATWPLVARYERGEGDHSSYHGLSSSSVFALGEGALGEGGGA